MNETIWQQNMGQASYAASNIPERPAPPQPCMRDRIAFLENEVNLLRNYSRMLEQVLTQILEQTGVTIK